MKPKQLIFHDSARDKVRRGIETLALQNAASIASLILTIDCVIATPPRRTSDERSPHLEVGVPEF